MPTCDAYTYVRICSAGNWDQEFVVRFLRYF